MTPESRKMYDDVNEMRRRLGRQIKVDCGNDAPSGWRRAVYRFLTWATTTWRWNGRRVVIGEDTSGHWDLVFRRPLRWSLNVIEGREPRPLASVWPSGHWAMLGLNGEAVASGRIPYSSADTYEERVLQAKEAAIDAGMQRSTWELK